MRDGFMSENYFNGRLTVTPVEAASCAFNWSPKTTYSNLSRGKFPIPLIKINGRWLVRVPDLLNFISGLPTVIQSHSTQTSPKRKGAPTKAVSVARKAALQQGKVAAGGSENE